MQKRQNMHRQMPAPPLAYFLTLRTYGTWLHGNMRGSVDPRHNDYGTPRLPANSRRLECEAARSRSEPQTFNTATAALVEQTITEVCQHRHWHLFCVAARTNHVHVLVQSEHAPERVMSDFKAWCTRRLRESEHVGPRQDVWADHGSTQYVWSEQELLRVLEYVENGQGPPLSC